jgi:hypothetical protein
VHPGRLSSAQIAQGVVERFQHGIVGGRAIGSHCSDPRSDERFGAVAVLQKAYLARMRGGHIWGTQSEQVSTTGATTESRCVRGRCRLSIYARTRPPGTTGKEGAVVDRRARIVALRVVAQDMCDSSTRRMALAGARPHFDKSCHVVSTIHLGTVHARRQRSAIYTSGLWAARRCGRPQVSGGRLFACSSPAGWCARWRHGRESQYIPRPALATCPR